MKKLTAATLLSAASIFGLSGCTTSGNLTPQYVPPSTYQSYDCQALTQEYNRVNSYVEATRNERSTLSSSGVGVGISAGRYVQVKTHNRYDKIIASLLLVAAS